jgi:hypothetical protein
MKIAFHIVNISLILQLLALSGIPPQFMLGERMAEWGNTHIVSQGTLKDGSLLPGQFPGQSKDEQTEFFEDETIEYESFLHLAVLCKGQSMTTFFYQKQALFPEGELLYLLKTPLFILFHCWKLDFL